MAGDWRRQHRKDPYHRAARKTGYRARSAYKLKQIQQRHKIIKKGDSVVDLGAAPGGWSQVARELVGDEGVVIGVDLVPIRPLDGVRTIKGDLTKQETRQRVLEIIDQERDEPQARVDCVISDMSPKLSGNYGMDQARSRWLADHALSFAEDVLCPGGNLVVKLFEGEDFIELREILKKRFDYLKTDHPAASRKASSEVYLVAKGLFGDERWKEAEDQSDADRGDP